ncbi:MAG: 3-deoxy-7-phosphoheptulonate synthase [Gammaproteobacteria bacterium]|jgi:3-deoxy-7-phosphoheptulonate synthase|nr:3-deoxy-7-phosphoheptulonate synthase [Gammaproteobacteria bacterium]|tara:strand:+ start:4243 stop:5343 length:1101 start_codon:yes stop_codon:yes gene_type:complete
MTELKVDDINVLSEETLINPNKLKQDVPASDRALETVSNGRLAIKRILAREDPRLLLIVGPCSIHNSAAALDYAARLKVLADEVSDTLLLVMRVYFEKPRTTVGWKGFINDPHMNDSFNIAEGLHLGRKLLVDLADMGLPTSTEALDPVSPQYLQDMICWSAIGARTAESQTHREMASGLSSAVGFKNGTDGSLGVAINALKSVSAPHRFLGINHTGEVAVIHTRGNNHAHIVLRGGGGRPNYDSVSVSMCEQQLLSAGVAANIMIDCSHANSGKDPAQQQVVMNNVGNQIFENNQSIIGLMVESNIAWGSQSIPGNLDDLEYGVSVTDACVDWQTTETMIRELREKVKDKLDNRPAPGLVIEKSA